MDFPSSGIEIGMGIHNESGHRRLYPIPELSKLVPQLLDLITSTSDPSRSFLPFKGQDRVILMVNNLGGVSELELGAIVAQVTFDLQSRGVVISRILSGTYMVYIPPSVNFLDDKFL
jgi:dihydroxyacetone kinase